ncbi:MAG: hypothetical protein ACXVB0_22275 [Mucilaginibacter sp.]
MMNYEDRMNLGKLSLILIIIIGFAYNENQNTRAKRWEFKGVVQNVRYEDIKHIPIIKVNGKEYDLFKTDWDSQINIYVGDTMIKPKGSSKIYLIRANTHDTINYRNPN